VLESGLKADTGAADSTRFFNRAAWVGVAGGFGEARLGRQDSAIGDIAGNVLGAQPYDDLVIVGTRAGGSYRRVDNTATYLLPALVPGLDVQLQYSTAAVGTTKSSTTTTAATAGSEVADSDYGKSFGLSAKYAAGPLSAGISYLNVKDDDNGVARNQKANATLGYVGYDFGLAKVTAYYDVETNPSNNTTATSVNTARLWVAGAKVAVPFTPEFTLVTGLSTAHNVRGLAASSDNVEIVTIKGIYALSKRTSLYGMFTNVNNDTATYLGADSTKNSATSLAGSAVTKSDKTTRAIAVGIRHSF
jgi:predicted porin